MTLKVKKAYLEAIRSRYYNSDKRQKSLILDELCVTTGFARKYAIKILAKGHKEGKKLSGRSKVYSKDAIFHLQKLWHIMDHMCSKKMVVALPTWLVYYQAPNYTKQVEEELLSMSAATIDRYLRSYRAKFASYRRSGTRYGKRFKQIIPIKPFTTNIDRPGFIEADTVAHCGNSLSGKFIWTLTMTDVFSGWTNTRAIFTKDAQTTLSAIDEIDRILPYDMCGFNVDNGTEFLNKSLYEYMSVIKGVEMTRTRPYRKNDNCHVEQKNHTHVREVFGYERYDQVILVKYMNEIYTEYQNLLYNFFVPQLKMVSKYREGAKYRRKYDKPKTPYQRLLESKHLTKGQKEALKRQYNLINPISLKREMSRKISQFRKLKQRLDGEYYYFAG